MLGWDLVEQFGQHGGVAHFIAGDFNRSNLQRLLVDPDVDLAPNTAFLTPVFTGVPLAFALNLDRIRRLRPIEIWGFRASGAGRFFF